MKTLLIVESPAKSKTIEKLLGNDYIVKSSFGHIRDLEKENFGVDIENGFKPNYKIIDGKGKVINDLKNAAKSVNRVLLAADEDREGEAIAWHVAVILKLNVKDNNRITFS
jgi:DNA topoisomerase-1